MNDAITGGAPAPAETNAAPIPEAAPHTQPLGSQTPVAEKPEAPVEKATEKPEPKEVPSKSAGDAIRKAQEALKAKEEAKPAEKPQIKSGMRELKGDELKEAKEVLKRGDDGKFVATAEGVKPAEKPAEAVEAKPAPQQPAKPDSPHREPPARFSPDAKAAWESAPDPIKAETHRAIRELEEGHQKYRESADRYEKVREFDELARKNGREGVHESLKQVVELENAFTRNPIEGFQKVADHFGLSLRAVAAHIMGQKPEEVQSRQDSTIIELKSKIAQLEQQVGGVTKTFEEQRNTETLGKVQAFAKEHPRFDELSEDIEFFLKSGRTKDLSEAYSLAERLNPAPAASKPEPVIPAETPAPLNPAGLKSITGAPSNGSNPPEKKGAIPSSREALERAASRVGRI